MKSAADRTAGLSPRDQLFFVCCRRGAASQAESSSCWQARIDRLTRPPSGASAKGRDRKETGDEEQVLVSRDRDWRAVAIGTDTGERAGPGQG